jgi:hypothetical protein
MSGMIFLHVRLKVEGGNLLFRDHRRLGYTIEGVRHKHRIAFSSNALADVAHRRAQTERIRPDDDTRVRTGARMNECSVAHTVGRFDGYISLDDRHRGG